MLCLMCFHNYAIYNLLSQLDYINTIRSRKYSGIENSLIVLSYDRNPKRLSNINSLIIVLHISIMYIS